MSKSVWVCLESVHHTRRQARAEGSGRGVGGRVAASSAVMLTDTVPGGAVTQGDGLRHDCPINSTQCTSRASAHQHTHTENIRGSASIKVQRREMYCLSIVWFSFLISRATIGSCFSMYCRASGGFRSVLLFFRCSVFSGSTPPISLQMWSGKTIRSDFAFHCTLCIVCWWTLSAGTH